MPTDNRSKTCCFSGYRPEKMLIAATDDTHIPPQLYTPLLSAIDTAYAHGYSIFLSGMSRGFDLWAAQAVLIAAQKLPILLYAIQPFPIHTFSWELPWQRIHAEILSRADAVYSVCPQYSPESYFMRNRFLVEASSALICYFDGLSGGTQYTVQYAKHCQLKILNLADTQLSLALPPFAPLE